MLYDLGRGHVVSKATAYVTIFAGLLCGFIMLCVVLAIAVRIGDLIIGW
jgi:hypothetical protein